jgi:uncharacterized protein YdeI (YjbR/CyaY-like superfamily)
MKRSTPNPKVDFYFNKEKKWQEEIENLREIALECGLTEELKWGCPCYTLANTTGKQSNIVLIHVFKEYCAYLFFKGALLPDPKGILVQQTANVQAARQIRFTNVEEIKKMEPLLKKYIKEAIKVEQTGLKVPLKKVAEFKMPAELQQVLKEDQTLKKAFEALTPGRQRGYILYFSAAKQSETRIARIEKSIPKILKLKGLND